MTAVCILLYSRNNCIVIEREFEDNFNFDILTALAEQSTLSIKSFTPVILLTMRRNSGEYTAFRSAIRFFMPVALSVVSANASSPD